MCDLCIAQAILDETTAGHPWKRDFDAWGASIEVEAVGEPEFASACYRVRVVVQHNAPAWSGEWSDWWDTLDLPGDVNLWGLADGDDAVPDLVRQLLLGCYGPELCHEYLLLEHRARVLANLEHEHDNLPAKPRKCCERISGQARRCKRASTTGSHYCKQHRNMWRRVWTASRDINAARHGPEFADGILAIRIAERAPTAVEKCELLRFEEGKAP